jgi:hypothetical protein
VSCRFKRNKRHKRVNAQTVQGNKIPDASVLERGDRVVRKKPAMKETQAFARNSPTTDYLHKNEVCELRKQPGWYRLDVVALQTPGQVKGKTGKQHNRSQAKSCYSQTLQVCEVRNGLRNPLQSIAAGASGVVDGRGKKDCQGLLSGKKS